MGHTPTMKTFQLLFIPFVTSVTLHEREAKSALSSSRSKRANGALEESRRSSHLERECVEETCSWEEYLEIAENTVSRVRESMRRAELAHSNPTLEVFDKYYTNCHQKVIAAGLDDKSNIDFRPHCMKTFFLPKLEEVRNE